MALAVLPENRVIRSVAELSRKKRAFSLFLGAGASKSSGVPLAGEMIWEWKQEAYRDAHPDVSELEPETVVEWAKGEPWASDPDHEYSELFEALYRSPLERQSYLEGQIEGAQPSWGYLYLASLIAAGHFNIVYTTNFDDLVNDALSTFLGYNPVVCAVDSQVALISSTSERAKIIKLHGDYLFSSIKNTRTELAALTANMEKKLRQFSAERGLVVVGYAGRDRSVMSLLESLLDDENEDYFPTGIYWAIRDGEEETLPSALASLVERHPDRLHLFRCNDFDRFMAGLHERTECELPRSITEPLDVVKRSFGSLLELSPDLRDHQKIARDHGVLTSSEDLEIAKGGSRLLLYDAQVSLMLRDYRAAIDKVEAYHQHDPESDLSLLILGSAYAVQSEETGDRSLMDRAAEAWRRAIEINPDTILPRKSLAGHAMSRGDFEEAMPQLEQLLRISPRDIFTRANLVQLYLRVHRHSEALQQSDVLVQAYPDDPEALALRAQVLSVIGRRGEAVEQIERAIELAPDVPAYRIGRASALQQAGRLQEAEQAFRHCAELEPENPHVWQQLCLIYAFTNQMQPAMHALERLRTLAPHMAQAFEMQMQANLQAQGGANPQQVIGQALGNLVRSWIKQ